jgi:hypothetical protein
VREGLNHLSPKALTTLKETLESDEIDHKLRIQTALEVLDHTGFGKKAEGQRQEHLHLHAYKDVKNMSEEKSLKEVMQLIKES